MNQAIDSCDRLVPSKSSALQHEPRSHSRDPWSHNSNGLEYQIKLKKHTWALLTEFAISPTNTALIVSHSKKCLCLFVVAISSQAGCLFFSAEKRWFGSLTPSAWKLNLTCKTIKEKKALAISFYKHPLLLSIFWQISDSIIICWHPFQGFNCYMRNYKFSFREQSIDCVIIIAVQIEYFILAALLSVAL